MPTEKLPPKSYSLFQRAVQNGDMLVRVVDSQKAFASQGPDSPNRGVHDALLATGGDRTATHVELEQLSNPDKLRIIYRANVFNRDTIKDLRTGKIVRRARLAAGEAARRAMVNKPPKMDEYYVDGDVAQNPIPRPVAPDAERGAGKQTKYTKKRPCDILTVDYKFIPFNRGNPYIGFGFIEPLTHNKGGRYIFRENAVTNNGFWVDPPDARPYRNATKVSDLKREINPDHTRGGAVAFNRRSNSELLVGFSAEALAALFVVNDNLDARINLLDFYVHELEVHNPRRIAEGQQFAIPVVPLVILPGNGSVREYDMVNIRADLDVAFASPGGHAKSCIDRIAAHFRLPNPGYRVDDIMRAYGNMLKANEPGVVAAPVIGPKKIEVNDTTTAVDLADFAARTNDFRIIDQILRHKNRNDNVDMAVAFNANATPPQLHFLAEHAGIPGVLTGVISNPNITGVNGDNPECIRVMLAAMRNPNLDGDDLLEILHDCMSPQYANFIYGTRRADLENMFLHIISRRQDIDPALFIRILDAIGEINKNVVASDAVKAEIETYVGRIRRPEELREAPNPLQDKLRGTVIKPEEAKALMESFSDPIALSYPGLGLGCWNENLNVDPTKGPFVAVGTVPYFCEQVAGGVLQAAGGYPNFAAIPPAMQLEVDAKYKCAVAIVENPTNRGAMVAIQNNAEGLRQVTVAMLYLTGHIDCVKKTFKPEGDAGGEVTDFLKSLPNIDDYIIQGCIVLQGIVDGNVDLADPERAFLNNNLKLHLPKSAKDAGLDGLPLCDGRRRLNGLSAVDFFGMCTANGTERFRLPNLDSPDKRRVVMEDEVNKREDHAPRWTKLHRAVYGCEVAEVDRLLKQGAAIVRDDNGCFPFDIQMYSGFGAERLKDYRNSCDMVRREYELINKQEDAPPYWTPLHRAVYAADLDRVIDLLSKGVEVITTKGGHPLDVQMYEAFSGDKDKIEKYRNCREIIARYIAEMERASGLGAVMRVYSRAKLKGYLDDIHAGIPQNNALHPGGPKII